MKVSTLGYNISIELFLSSIEDKYEVVRQSKGKLFIFDNGKMYVAKMSDIQDGLVMGSFEMEFVKDYVIDYSRSNQMQFSALVNEYFSPYKVRVESDDLSDETDVLSDESEDGNTLDEDESEDVLIEDLM